MHSMTTAFDALDGAVTTVGELDVAAADPTTRLRALERLETARRRLLITAYDLVAGLAHEDPADVGGPVHKVIADWLRISCAEARRRMRDAEQLMPRITITGETLPPELPATAQVWRDGVLDPQHLKVIQTFVRDLPADTPLDTVERAERFLAEQSSKLRPDQLEKVANRCSVLINPDGKFSDIDRARQRGFTWSPQRSDGMSHGKLVASPELRANLDAWLARCAAPGMCNPDHENLCATDEPDIRSHAQRQHDAINVLVRGQLGDPKLGVHNGLPVTVVVSTTLQELSSATGQAVTGGGTVLPMRDLIRMASRAYHYLAVFDEHQNRPLYLGRARRIASADQRLVLHAKDRGCTAPGCNVPAYWTEVHHMDDWARGGRTDIDRLTLACKPDHTMVDKGWRTIKVGNGDAQWIPPPHLDHGQPTTNDYHHPEKIFDNDRRRS
ncbi:MAG TPA: HNH endonuclease signature motif containing protein [Mycobacterium sp.]